MNDSSVKDLFDTWAASYDSYLAKSPFYEQLIETLVGKINLRKGDTLLDIGVGTGNVAFRFASRFKCDISGIDISRDMLAECQRNADSRGIPIALRQDTFENISFPDQHFDAAVAAFAIHHVPDERKVRALQEIRRTIKHGGLFGIAEVMVDVEGDTSNEARLRHILVRWGYAALLALKHGGPECVDIELRAIRDIYMRNGEYLVSVEQWKSMLQEAQFSVEHSLCTNEQLGHWVILARA